MRVRALIGVGAAALTFAGAAQAAQTITIVNEAHVPHGQVLKFEGAMRWEAHQLRLAWGWRSREVRFGSGGWHVVLVRLDAKRLDGAQGWHATTSAGAPYALVGVTGNWTVTASHEIGEMLEDSQQDRWVHGWLVEAADPYAEAAGIRHAGVELADFATPAWFGIGRGHRFDLAGLGRHAHGLSWGYEYQLAADGIDIRYGWRMRESGSRSGSATGAG